MNPPCSTSERAYALLREAIRQSSRVGIAKVILRDTQHLAAVEAIEQALVLTMMRFADELVDISTFRFPGQAEARGKELDLATALIENLASEWKPEKYTDEYSENLMRIIHAKLKGRKPRLKEAQQGPRGTEIVDLMSRLQKSLADAKGARKNGRRRKSRAA